MFRDLKDKTKVVLTDCAYNDIFLSMLMSMFDYKNLPFRKMLIEGLLLTTGKVGIYKEDDKLYCGWCMFSGDINEYGFGSDVTIMTLSNKQKFFPKWEESKDVVVIFNDNIGMPDLNIDRISKYLSDVDKSIENAILNTRSTKIYRAKDEKEKKAIESAIESNKDGRPSAIISSNILNDMLSSEAKEQIVVDLTDPTQVDKIQYLCNLHTTILRRMQTIYGMMTAGTDKIAQQSVSEINNGSSFSFIVPVDRLEERKKGIEKVNELFNTNISVDFGEAMQREYEKHMVQMEVIEDNTDDITEDNTTDDIIENKGDNNDDIE